jgi:hypothetical protein
MSGVLVEYWNLGRRYFLKKNKIAQYTFTPHNNELKLDSIAENPSIIYSNGTKEWHCLGCLQRYDGPAVIYANGDVEYWRYGLRHRKDGPAVTIGNKKYWFVLGEFQKCTH